MATTETRTVVVQLKKTVALGQGKGDSKGRWEITDSRIGQGSTCEVCGVSLRSPSAAYPYSVLKHCYSKAHALRCLEAGLVTMEDCETEERAYGPKATTVYKILRVLPDGRWVSGFDNETEYRLGETLTQTAQTGHQGGYYGYEGKPSADGTDVDLALKTADGYGYRTTLRHRFVRADLVLPESRCTPGTYVLVECRGEGRKLRYSGDPNCAHGKLCFSRLTPVRVLAAFEVDHFLTKQACPECGGRGYYCLHCDGRGWIWA